MNKILAFALLCIAFITNSLSFAMATSSITDAKHKPIMIKFFKTVYDQNDLEKFRSLLNGLSQNELADLWSDILALLVVGMRADSQLIIKNRQFYNVMKSYAEQLEYPLHKAVRLSADLRSDTLSQIRSLITPETINSTNVAGESPLFVALASTIKNDNLPALKMQYEIAHLLLQAGASPCLATSAGLTPLMVCQSPMIAQLLLKYGAGACINKQDIRGNSALLNAISYYKQYDKSLFLINSGANVNAKNQYGYTALHMTAFNPFGNVEKSMNLLQKLLSSGALLNAQTNEGNTALHHAIEIKEPLLVGLLLQHAANVDIKNNDGLSARKALLQTWHMTPQEFLENYKKPDFKKIVVQRSFVLPEQEPKKQAKAPAPVSKKATKKGKMTYNQRQQQKANAQDTLSTTPPSPEITQNASANIPALETATSKEPILKAGQIRNKIDVTGGFAQRLLNWWDDQWLAKEKQKAKDEGLYEYWKFMQGRVYHRLPQTVINTIIEHGKTSSRANETYKDFVDTVYTMKGEIQFENLTNPWNPGKLSQPGYYHVTVGKHNKIYHIGFKATQDNTRTLSQFMPGSAIPVEWATKQTPHYTAIYDKGEGVRHVLYLEN